MSFSSHNPQPSPSPSVPSYASATVTPHTSKKALAAVGIACAVLGLVLSLVKGLLSVGWAFLALGYLLGCLALVFKGHARKLAAAAIAVALVGSLAGGAFFARIATKEGLSEAFLATNFMTFNPKDARLAWGKSNPGETFSNPLPAGSTVSTEYWDAKINSVDLDATDALMQYSDLSTPPLEGEVHILINVTMTYKKAIPAPAPAVPTLDYYVAEDTPTTYVGYRVFEPDPFYSLEQWEVGKTRTGNIALPAPAENPGDGIISIQLFPSPDKIYIRLQ